MLLGLIIEFAVGAALVVMGVLLWKKRMVSLLHDYHYKNVSEEDMPAYTRQMGAGLVIIGAGIIITGLCDIAGSRFWWVSLTAGIAIGLAVILRAQKRYNGSVLG